MTVLVAYHACPHGEEAVRTALAESQRRDLPLHVVVLDPQPDDAPTPEALVSALDGATPAITYRRDATDPSDAILDTAEEAGATLVVLGSRKRSSDGSFLMGTTTQRVLLDSPVPVLVVKDAYDTVP